MMEYTFHSMLKNTGGLEIFIGFIY